MRPVRRAARIFETDDPALAWLNNVQAVGKGMRDGAMLLYELHELD